MTRIYDDPTRFSEDALDGLAELHPSYLRRVNGGVIRSTVTPPGQVALVIGGGSGHYPAFAGLVGPGLASGAACGNLFASPSASQVYRVAKAADHGGGVLLSYGNYAGDVLHFGQAEQQLRDEGTDVRTVRCTDDVASAPLDQIAKRRGIAGDLVVFKIAGAAAETGTSLDEVERLARKANDRTRSLGVAFDGCTLPGADAPLFDVPEGQMSIGLGIHGEPGISEQAILPASELASLLVSRLLEEIPEGASTRVVPIVNGLGTVKHEELFVLYRRIAAELREAGLEIVEPECGELVTSLDMGGVSLTLLWLDEELEQLWSAPADTPAYRKGGAAVREIAAVAETAVDGIADVQPASELSVQLAGTALRLLEAVGETLATNAEKLGQIDAIAGDGDHGIGMLRGVRGAVSAAQESRRAGHGVEQLLAAAGAEWSERGGGTSGALWGAALQALGKSLADPIDPSPATLASAVDAAIGAVTSLGGAALGDKTMVDAMIPYREAVTTSVAAGESILAALAAGARVAEEAAAATASLQPRLGRARPLAEKSMGHPDAGAVSFALMMDQIATAAEEEEKA